ncbi:MAG: TrmH family RNA methyltransferase [Bacteroidota bacterium]
MAPLRILSNARTKKLRKLQRRKYRKKFGLFVIEGQRAVRQMAENGSVTINWLLFDEQNRLWEQAEWKSIVASNQAYQIDRGSFIELANTDHPQGVLAVCAIPQEPSLDEVLSNPNFNRIVALDELQDPGNLGTIIRSAVWFGADALLLGQGTVDPWNPKVVRSTAGATGSIPLLSVDLRQLPEANSFEGWQSWRLETSEQSRRLKEAKPLPERLILVIGNEGHGIRNYPQGAGIDSIEIGSASDNQEVESLNAGVAASITLFAVSSS